MEFLIKFLRELNSADSQKFISLAIVLGLVSGFLPGVNLITFLILFFVFVFRIPLGLYFASWSFFEIIAFVLDPVFAYTGWELLHFKFLEPLWEWLYNIPYFRWSDFNNTVVLGSFIWGVVLGVVVYILLNHSIEIYRKKLFPFFSKYKLLKWLVPKEEKKGVFRLSGLIAFLGVVGLISGFIYVATPFIVKKAFEVSVSKITRKPVKVKKVDVSFGNLKVDLKGVYVGDVKIDTVLIKFSFKELMWKKCDIEKLVISKVYSNKNIEEIVKVKNVSSKPSKTADFKLNIKIPDASKVLANYELKSKKELEVLKKDYENFLKIVNKSKQDAKIAKEKLNSIKLQIDSLKNTKPNANNISDIIQKVKNLDNEISKIDSLIKSDKKEVLKAKEKIKKDLKAFKEAVNEDYLNIEKRYDMLKNKEYLSFVESFLKPQISEYINKALYWYERVKPYLKSSSKEEKSRFKGVYVKFKDKNVYPDCVLEHFYSNVILKNASFVVNGYNISSNQKLLNKSAILKIDSKSKYFDFAFIKIEYLNEFKFFGKVDKLKVKDYFIGPLKISSADFDVRFQGILKDKFLKLNIKAFSDNSIIEFLNSKKVTSLLKNVKKLEFDIEALGKIENLKLRIHSNLDSVLSSVVKRGVNEEIEKEKKKAKKLLTSQVGSLKLENTDFLNLDTNSLKKELKKLSENELKKRLKDNLKEGINKFLKF